MKQSYSSFRMALLLSCACFVSASAAEAVSQPAGIEVESVVLRLIAEAEVPAQEAGVLAAVAVREGQRVKQGELLAQIDDRVARLALEAAERQLEIARAEATNDVRRRYAEKALEVSEAELRRSTESIERFAKSVSQSQLDVERLTVEKNRLEAEQAEHDIRIATFEMRAKENELAAARDAVERRKIVAPFDGVIVQVYARQGEWVQPGQRALRIVGIEQLKAEGFVPAEQATANLVGAKVRLTTVSITASSSHKAGDGIAGSVTGDPPAAAGTVVFVSPEVDPITGQVRVWAEIDNRDGRLRPGQPAQMTIDGR